MSNNITWKIVKIVVTLSIISLVIYILYKLYIIYSKPILSWFSALSNWFWSIINKLEKLLGLPTANIFPSFPTLFPKNTSSSENFTLVRKNKHKYKQNNKRCIMNTNIKKNNYKY